MRLLILIAMSLIIGFAMLEACNSKDPVITKLPSSSPPLQTNTSATNPTDNARRIGAEELHTLWGKKNVLIIDTRDEASFKASHIPGAISVPANMVAAKVDELPREKMIVAYCT